MKSYVTSQITGIDYAVEDVVRIINHQQAIYYVNSGLKLLDIYTSINGRTKLPIFVYIFDRKASREIYDRWCNQGAREVYGY